MNNRSIEENMLTSHRIFRLVIGSLGIALPLILIFWGFGIIGWTIQDSISDYYSLRTRDAFVGILFIIGWFLFSYRGHEPLDNNLGYAACLFAIGVAFFPNSGAGWERIVHFTCAAGLFVVLAFFSMFLFTKTAKSKEGFGETVKSFRFGVIKSDEPKMQRKKKRNTIYITCGIVILLCLVLVMIYNTFLKDTSLANIKPVFWLEAIMIWAFGISWFVKGETLFKDKDEKKSEAK